MEALAHSKLVVAGHAAALPAAFVREVGAKAQPASVVRVAERLDPIAFKRIVEAHQGAIYGYLRARVLQASDAEDLTQEVFLRYYAESDRFDHRAALRAWLVGIARNVLRERARRVKRRKEVAWTSLCLELEDDAPPADTRFDEAARHLPNCLESLGPSARQAIDLRYRAQLRLAEIGHQLHRSEGAIKLLMFRAKQALRHCLEMKSGGGQA
ncbi:MAG: RNA polymerase sigma factor [Pirellulales bacterium]